MQRCAMQSSRNGLCTAIIGASCRLCVATPPPNRPLPRVITTPTFLPVKYFCRTSPASLSQCYFY